MEIIKNKNAFELAISTLVVFVLAIVLLVALVVTFTIGWGNFKESLWNFFSASSISSSIESCNIACANNVKYDFCCINKTAKFGNKKESLNCLDKRLEVKCETIVCEENYCKNIENNAK